MIDLEFVERLIKALDESSLDTVELERGGTRILLSKSSSQAQASVSPAMPAVAAPPAPAVSVDPASPPSAPSEGEESEQEDLSGYLEVTSPMVGTFYSAPAPDAPAYVEVGQRVGKGTVLCIIEAMKLMNELESEVEGTIARVLVDNSQPVEYGQALFLIDPS
jgi:acetyl-CoA carboxylase biotin carboxyl carrier protein